MVELSVIIVLYDEYESVVRCLESVYKNKVFEMEVILVHNNSGVKGVEKVLKKFPKVIYIKNRENLGFGPAVNIGIKKSRGAFVLVLTPDTSLYANTVQPTLAYIKQHPDVSLVGCRVFSDSKVHPSAFHGYPDLLTHLYEYNIPFLKMIRKFNAYYHPTMYTKKAHKYKMSVKHIIGAYLLLRKEALVQVGNFDKRFFLYREETDLCKRLIDAGWKIIFLPVGGVEHYGGGSTRSAITQCSPHYQKSTYLFFKKYNGVLYAFVAWFIGILSATISIPFLIATILVRKIDHKPTQSSYLLKCWSKIFVWHIRHGLNVIFSS